MSAAEYCLQRSLGAHIEPMRTGGATGHWAGNLGWKLDPAAAFCGAPAAKAALVRRAFHLRWSRLARQTPKQETHAQSGQR